MTEKNAKPQLRFAGFDDTWEQRKAVDIADYSKGNGYSKSDLTEIGTPIILYGRLYTKYQFAISEVDTFATPKDGSVYSQGNEVIIPASGETAEDIARASAVEKSGILLGGDLNILRPFNFINPLFLALTISSGEPQKELAKKAQGKSVVHIHNSDIQEVSVSFPTRAEQDRIVAVFRHLDNLITLHQRKYDKLTNVKKSMLEKMFPKNGSNVPEIRFKGFSDAWEQRKLGDCFTERVESMPDGELISVTINDGIKKFSELGRHDNSNDDKSKYKKVCVGDIAYNSMRMWQGASGYSSYEGIVSPAYTVLSPNSGINSKCLAYQFKLPEMIHTFQVNSQGITSDNWNLKYPVLSKIEIFVSKDEQEQAKIAEYFENLDNLITLHQRECIYLFS